MLHLFQVGTLLRLLSDPGLLLQNLRGWLHHGLELLCLSQWGPCLSHPPASLPCPVSPVPPPLPHNPHQHVHMQRIHLYLHTLPSLTLTLFLLSLYLPHLHHPQAHYKPTTHCHTLNKLHAPSKP